jgi:hypothetical protein
MHAVLFQHSRFPNIWSLRAALDHSVIIAGPFIDRMCRNGAFAADSAVEAAIHGHWQIVGIIVQDDEVRSPFHRSPRDTNMDAAEGALYRAAHGAFDPR